MKFNRLKRFLFIITALVLPLLSFGNDHMRALFEKGNAYYTKSQYKEAMATYQQILDAGYQSAAVYFNMGNAAYRSDDIAPALLYYEKAHKLAPGDEDINVNIRLANLKTMDKIDEAPEFFLFKWWRGFLLSFSADMLAILSISLMLAGSAALIIYFFTNSVAAKKTSFYISIILFFVSIITIFIASSQASYFNAHKQAIIFSNSVNVKSSPAAQSGTLFVLHDGTKINVLDNTNGWMKIKLANGNVGWIKSSDAKEI